jgi:hypothetical protein
MNLSSDFNVRVVQHAADAAWTPSPLPGVDRRITAGTKPAHENHLAEQQLPDIIRM